MRQSLAVSELFFFGVLGSFLGHLVGPSAARLLVSRTDKARTP